jgi:hypothetical protein
MQPPPNIAKAPRKSIDVHHVVSQVCMQEGKALTVMFNNVKVLPVMHVQRCRATRAVSSLEQAIARATRQLHFQWNGQVQTAQSKVVCKSHYHLLEGVSRIRQSCYLYAPGGLLFGPAFCICFKPRLCFLPAYMEG